MDKIEPLCHDRVIFVDFGLYMHKAIFATVNNPNIPATYTAMSMIVGDLTKIKYNKDDLVIVAIDGRGNWRKDLDPQYKANRKELREKSEIDWNYWYEEFNNLVEKLTDTTPFKYIKLDKCEADDIIAIGVKYFKDNPCIVMSADSDFEQLTAYENVHIFSPYSKKFKVVANPYKVIQSKIKKEKTDNLISEVLNELDFTRRKTLISLLHLPDFIEKKVLDSLSVLCYNRFNMSKMPFTKLRSRLNDIYCKEEVCKANVFGKQQSCINPECRCNRKRERRNKRDISSSESIF